MMDKQDHIDLSCRKIKGRYSRQVKLNELLKLSLAADGVLSRVEPIELTHNIKNKIGIIVENKWGR